MEIPESRISSSISSTAWLAPPWEGPERALIPEATLAKMSACEEPTTRTVAVEQFSSWSACRMSSMSTALLNRSPSSPLAALSPKVIRMKLST